MPQKVGKPYGPNKKKMLTYEMVVPEVDGWVDTQKYLPADFDMVDTKGNYPKIIPGWHTGAEWDGLHIKDGMQISHWKKRREWLFA